MLVTLAIVIVAALVIAIVVMQIRVGRREMELAQLRGKRPDNAYERELDAALAASRPRMIGGVDASDLTAPDIFR